jgi:hypothetical protein
LDQALLLLLLKQLWRQQQQQHVEGPAHSIVRWMTAVAALADG